MPVAAHPRTPTHAAPLQRRHRCTAPPSALAQRRPAAARASPPSTVSVHFGPALRPRGIVVGERGATRVPGALAPAGRRRRRRDQRWAPPTLPGVTAAVLALLSASAFAVSTVVQHRAATRASVPPGRAAALRLALVLIRTPAWLTGQAAAAGGFILHAAALRNGPVVMVQPILSGGLVLALVLGALVDRRHPQRSLPDGRQWRAAGIVVVGLTVFLLAARPHRGQSVGHSGILLGGVGVALVIVAASWLWARLPSRPHRALALGIAAGCGFGMTGVLLKQVVRELPHGWPSIWPPILLLLVGGASIVCAQSAYQAGLLIESLPTMTVLEPIIAILVASRAYHELLAQGWLARLGQLVGLATLAAGVVGLARARSPHRPVTTGEACPLP